MRFETGLRAWARRGPARSGREQTRLSSDRQSDLERWRCCRRDGDSDALIEHSAHRTTYLGPNEQIPNDLAALHAARFVSAVESEDGRRLAEAKIKQVTGGDMITARFLHKEFFNFTPQFKIWLATNYRPVIYGTDEGIWRRIRLVPFDVCIPDGQVDEKLKDKLISEASGILNWALAGLEEYRQNGLMEPDIVTGATEEYRAAQDWLSRFLEETTEPSQTESVGARALYEKYKEWAHNVGEFVLKEAKFADAMKAKVGKPQRLRMPDGKQVKSYVGLKFRQSLANWRPNSEAMLEDVETL